MITIEKIRSLSNAELERWVYALADDAGAFNIPQVRAIVAKFSVGEPANEELSQDIADLEEDIAGLRADIGAADRKLTELKARRHG